MVEVCVVQHVEIAAQSVFVEFSQRSNHDAVIADVMQHMKSVLGCKATLPPLPLACFVCSHGRDLGLCWCG